MRNFNTNQTRHFYVKGITVDGVATTAEIGKVLNEANGDVVAIYVKGTNADNLAYRSDTIDVKRITSVKQTASAKMATPLLKHTIVIDTAEFANAAALAGKTAKLAITVHQLFDYDDSNCVTFTVSHKVAASESDTDFYAAFKALIEKAMPKPDANYPYFEVTADASGLYITEKVQKYVRGKLTGEPVHISVAFGIASDSYLDDTFVAWGKDTVSTSGSVPANYALADLEYFAYGERGDYFRGNNWPNNVEPTYAINPKSTAAYDVLSIEYYYAGGAEDVQKSPRLIQIAGSASDISSMLADIKKLLPAFKSDVTTTAVGG